MDDLVRESKTRHRSEKILDKTLFKQLQKKSPLVSQYERQVKLVKKAQQDKDQVPKPKIKTDIPNLMRKMLIKAKSKISSSPYSSLGNILKILKKIKAHLKLEHLLWVQVFVIKNLIPLNNTFYDLSKTEVEKLGLYTFKEIQIKSESTFLEDLPILEVNWTRIPSRQMLGTLLDLQTFLKRRISKIKNVKKKFKSRVKEVHTHLSMIKQCYESTSFELNPVIEYFQSLVSNTKSLVYAEAESIERDSKVDLRQKVKLKPENKETLEENSEVILSSSFYYLTLLISSLGHLKRNYLDNSKQSYIHKLFRPLNELTEALKKVPHTEMEVFVDILKSFFFTVNSQKQMKQKVLVKRQEMDRNLDLNTNDFRNNQIVQKGHQQEDPKNNKVIFIRDAFMTTAIGLSSSPTP